VVDDYVEAKNAGINTRPVLLGPVPFLLLSKASSPDFTTLDTLPVLVSVYIEILQRLVAVGADWVQIDEACLVLDLDEVARSAYTTTYSQLGQVANINIMVATYFGGLEDNLSMAANLPVAAYTSIWCVRRSSCKVSRRSYRMRKFYPLALSMGAMFGAPILTRLLHRFSKLFRLKIRTLSRSRSVAR
jgi:hypothetical protein